MRRLLVVVLAVLIGAGCASTRTVKRVEKKPAPKKKPTTIPARKTPFQRARLALQRMDYIHYSTQHLLGRVDRNLKELRFRLPKRMRRLGLDTAKAGKLLLACFKTAPAVIKRPYRVYRSSGPTPSDFRRYDAKRVQRIVDSMLKQIARCPRVGVPTDKGPVKATHQQDVLKAVLSNVDTLRVLLRIDLPRRMAWMRRQKRRADLLSDEIKKFEKTIILPTFKDPDATGGLKRAARKKLLELRRRQRQLRRAIRRLERDLKLTGQKTPRRIDTARRYLTRL